MWLKYLVVGQQIWFQWHHFQISIEIYSSETIYPILNMVGFHVAYALDTQDLEAWAECQKLCRWHFCKELLIAHSCLELSDINLKKSTYNKNVLNNKKHRIIRLMDWKVCITVYVMTDCSEAKILHNILEWLRRMKTVNILICIIKLKPSI